MRRQAGLDIIVDRAKDKSVDPTRISEGSAFFTSTIDSFNRVRDAEMVEKYIGLSEEGNESTEFLSAHT